ncbi:MAG: bifunctional riboflavin kinase/FAD synthetase [Anaerolineaceae bacterium]|jgi:riboflavin kinase/FMN adenylyltransferase|nr:bifunctional riboflavin kinase/FAD synthetase [Anaerolineaceae bacterium]
MEHYRSLDSLQLKNACVTVGAFDGIHLGHQEIIRRLVQESRHAGVPAVVITFFPHPAAVLGKNAGAFYLTTAEERADILASLGVDITVTLEFTRELAQQSAETFVQNIVKHLHPHKLIVGYDFSLGRNRQGNIATLQELGKQHDFQVEVVPPVTLNGEKISSSRVRQALENHDIETANALLGRAYAVHGSVTYGDRRGGKLGIPTANLEYPKDRLIPPRGVYATIAHLDNQRIASVTNIGVHPTFDTGLSIPTIEAHLLDFSGDIYTDELTLDFIHFIRPEQKFDSVAALLAQIDQDIQTARETLRHAA